MSLRKGMHVALRLAIACSFTGLAGTFVADAAAVEPGEYLYVEGSHAHGVLLVKGGRFAIDTIGGNCHTCSLTGTLKNNMGVASGDGETCRISITGDRGTLKVNSGSADGCRSYCGARAMFDGEYRQPAAACTDRLRTARLTQARAQYAKKNYAAAEAAFTSLIGECARDMDWIEVDRVRSDLALTQYHLGERAKCLATLSQTTAMLNHDDRDKEGDPSFGLPPCDADNYQSTGKAILHNATLCNAPIAARGATN
ncbi:hypothetical protein [Burkholderia arboris]|uniref:hypothetical protein n=3 Tax=Burkholderia arboris TaxID=488730 RepID=UPI001FC8C9F7|nr:hypothetical protein [Burkholderia arboris]